MKNNTKPRRKEKENNFQPRRKEMKKSRKSSTQKLGNPGETRDNFFFDITKSSREPWGGAPDTRKTANTEDKNFSNYSKQDSPNDYHAFY